MAAGGLFTYAQFYNATGYSVAYVEQQNWYGGVGPVRYPIDITNGALNSIIHLNSDSLSARSSGGVLYRLQNADGDQFDWIVAWNNQLNYDNKAYTRVVRSGTSVDWDAIKQDLDKSSNEYTSVVSDGGYLARVSIDRAGNFPELHAVLTLIKKA